MEKEDITPYDKNNRRHGYWEMYYNDGKLDLKGIYIHGERHGLWLEYYDDGELRDKRYYII